VSMRRVSRMLLLVSMFALPLLTPVTVHAQGPEMRYQSRIGAWVCPSHRCADASTALR
jgi:hypothetical protein